MSNNFGKLSTELPNILRESVVKAVCNSLGNRGTFRPLRRSLFRVREFPTDMCQTSNMDHIFHSVVACISIGLQIPPEPLQELLGMFLLPIRLVFVQCDVVFRILPGAIEPHIALALCGFARLMKYLQFCFVCVEDFLLQKLPMKLLIDRLQPTLCALNDPIGRGDNGWELCSWKFYE